MGSGHDLRCFRSAKRLRRNDDAGIGEVIDQHDAVWRANAQQHYNILNHSSVGQIMAAAMRSHRAWRMMELLHHRGPTAYAGARTDYRANCLYAGYAVAPATEACLVGPAWFDQPDGRERFSNSRHKC